jgi:hypothetical protein
MKFFSLSERGRLTPFRRTAAEAGRRIERAFAVLASSLCRYRKRG